jgi:hypothetical protein
LLVLAPAVPVVASVLVEVVPGLLELWLSCHVREQVVWEPRRQVPRLSQRTLALALVLVLVLVVELVLRSRYSQRQQVPTEQAARRSCQTLLVLSKLVESTAPQELFLHVLHQSLSDSLHSALMGTALQMTLQFLFQNLPKMALAFSLYFLRY